MKPNSKLLVMMFVFVGVAFLCPRSASAWSMSNFSNVTRTSDSRRAELKQFSPEDMIACVISPTVDPTTSYNLIDDDHSVKVYSFNTIKVGFTDVPIVTLIMSKLDEKDGWKTGCFITVSPYSPDQVKALSLLARFGGAKRIDGKEAVEDVSTLSIEEMEKIQAAGQLDFVIHALIEKGIPLVSSAVEATE